MPWIAPTLPSNLAGASSVSQVAATDWSLVWPITNHLDVSKNDATSRSRVDQWHDVHPLTAQVAGTGFDLQTRLFPSGRWYCRLDKAGLAHCTFADAVSLPIYSVRLPLSTYPTTLVFSTLVWRPSSLNPASQLFSLVPFFQLLQRLLLVHGPSSTRPITAIDRLPYTAAACFCCASASG